MLHGPAGAGRSRLVDWLVAGLEEQGLARTLRVRLAPHTTPTEALAAALRRFLVVGATADDRLRERLATWFAARGHTAEPDVDALAGWLGGTERAALLAPREARARRLALVQTVLRLEAQRASSASPGRRSSRAEAQASPRSSCGTPASPPIPC